MAAKIVVTGPVNGNFDPVFNKLAKLHAKTSFSIALVAGDLFAAPDGATDEQNKALESLLNGTTKVPLPTYFTIGQHALPESVIQRIQANDGEVCTNLYFLGKCATTKTSDGIRIVTLGGTLDRKLAAGESKDLYLPFYTESDAKVLRGANRADILLTTHWPAGVQQISKVALPDTVQVPRAEQCVADLCTALQPRYHFSTSGEAFWEREPFAHAATEVTTGAQSVTRFISLASSTASSKAKWLYAFTLDPKAPNSTTTVPAGTTASPLAAPALKRSHQASSAQPAASTGMRNPKRRKKHQPPPGPSECFFCLANPNLSTHILTSIGDHAYLSTARGPLLERTTYPELPFQPHILIIPLAHAATLSSMPSQDEAQSTIAEMHRYRSALQTMVATKSNGTYGAVTWELSRTPGVHAHWQFLAIPRKLIADGLAEAAFRVQAENSEYPAFEARDAGDGSGEGDFFRVWLWTPSTSSESGPCQATMGQGSVENDDSPDAQGHKTDSRGGSETQLVLSLRDTPRFEIAFGRRVVAQLLQKDARVDWKQCVQTEHEETVDADAFKEAFKEWDFALA